MINILSIICAGGLMAMTPAFQAGYLGSNLLKGSYLWHESPGRRIFFNFFKISIGLYTHHSFNPFMARSERSRSRNEDSGNAQTFEEFMKGKGRRGSRRDSGRDSRRSSGRRFGRDSGRSSRGPKRFGNKRRDLEMTKVICAECGDECEIPFKPMTDKPVYCSDCFEKHDKKGSNKNSSKDLDEINKKLDKIMKALKIR